MHYLLFSFINLEEAGLILVLVVILALPLVVLARVVRSILRARKGKDTPKA